MASAQPMSTSRSYASSLSTHHRRSSSKVQKHAGTAPIGYVARLGAVHGDAEEDVKVTQDWRREHYAFPNASGTSPREERLGPILEQAGSSSSNERTGAGVSRISPVRHRVSPSLPYPPMDMKTLHGGQGGQAGAVKLIWATLRRARWLDLAFGGLFFGCVVVFFGALGGVGYAEVASPVMAAEAATVRPPIIMPQRAGQAPLVIKEDPEELAREDAERPVFARGRAAAAAAAVTPNAAAEAPKHIPAPMIMRRPPPPQPVIAQPHPPPAVPAITEPEDHAPDLVGDSPAHEHLDDSHAAHYHHPPEGNVFRGHAAEEGHHHDGDEESEEGHSVVAADGPTTEWVAEAEETEVEAATYDTPADEQVDIAEADAKPIEDVVEEQGIVHDG